MEYPKLKKILDDKLLLEDEKQMWLRIGMYVSTESYSVLNASNTGYIEVVKMWDAMGNKNEIGATFCNNLRRTVLAWWQVERVKPRASEPVDNTGMSQLESRNSND